VNNEIRARELMDKKMYKHLNASQKNYEFSIPSCEETADIGQYLYPHADPVYQKMKDFLENENSFSSPSRSANKRKELEIIQEEVIENITTETETNETNETPISTVPTQSPNFTNINNKLEENIPHQETNDDDNESNNNNNQHRKTIKNRLELLKQKIEKLKSSSNISSSNDNTDNINN
jgi:hypothetical protein